MTPDMIEAVPMLEEIERLAQEYQDGKITWRQWRIEMGLDPDGPSD